jgi:hypothetical protein
MDVLRPDGQREAAPLILQSATPVSQRAPDRSPLRVWGPSESVCVCAGGRARAEDAAVARSRARAVRVGNHGHARVLELRGSRRSAASALPLTAGSQNYVLLSWLPKYFKEEVQRDPRGTARNAGLNGELQLNVELTGAKGSLLAAPYSGALLGMYFGGW